MLHPEAAEEINTSDVDLVEFEDPDRGGRPVVRLHYCTENQRTHGTTTWADYEGTLGEFLRGYY